MRSKLAEDDAARGNNGETLPHSGNMHRSSPEPYYPKKTPPKMAGNKDVVLHQQSSRSQIERIGESINKRSEILRRIINHALGPLSEFIKKLRLPDSQRFVEGLEIERDELEKSLAYWQEECNRLIAYSNTLADDVRRLRSSLEIQSEGELIAEFNQLCYNIKNCSYNFEREGAHRKHTLGKCGSRELIAFVGLDPELDRYLLKTSTGRTNLSRAYLSRMLVNKVFHNESDDCGQIKDLWASESTAKDLAAIENRMKEIDLLPEEFNKWRSMTVRYLARKPLEDNVRVEMLVDELLQVLLGIFGLTGDSISADKLKRTSLGDPIVTKAVALSQSLRKQLSSISVCIGDSPNLDIHSALSMVDGGEESPEGRGKETTTLHISPSMVRITDEHGAEAAKVCVLVFGRLAHHNGVSRRTITARHCNVV